MKIVRGRNDRRPVTIQQLDSAAAEIVNAWRLDDAGPCRWSGPSFNAVGNEVAIEELELAYEELVWLAEPGTPKSMSRSRTKRRSRTGRRRASRSAARSGCRSSIETAMRRSRAFAS
jgi:hypothetical protein